MKLYAATGQSVYYAIYGVAPNRTIIFEYYASHSISSQFYYHFDVIFYEYRPNLVRCRYYEVYNRGLTATIGVQRSHLFENDFH